VKSTVTGYQKSKSSSKLVAQSTKKTANTITEQNNYRDRQKKRQTDRQDMRRQNFLNGKTV